MRVWIVDAFANQIFSGNPAGVVPVDRFPPEDLCQKIAAELNLSETAFIEISKPNSSFKIRWFTPKVEVKLCGHATLAAAHILFQEKMIQGNSLVFDSLSGPLKVQNLGDALLLDFPLQSTGPTLDKSPFEKVLGTEIAAVVKAYDDLIFELSSDDKVRDLNVSASTWNQFDCRGIIVTAKGSGDYDFISRFFAPRVGVDEDPVTGSAHCKLAHYWSQKLGKKKFLAYQASKRGGTVGVEVNNDRVFLKGKAITVFKGMFELPSSEMAEAGTSSFHKPT